ncbi:ABC transporter ATP-binding protein [Goodfellowiella coeruleoviolacea]|uniref:Molybdate transport system ATP-binding protein n=1 Tax=Goodfellowiella coeruleoviolacea TaxID=334858 RepID=A0AAE3KMF6_9PSEU|nr:ABC transporter ATP-binding protein [Goodfellowiella coeruleoviolacea]MCP2167543.1 molybdate transport system ATP-binding protein [Goodfellowiella coeruleoviolacea]
MTLVAHLDVHRDRFHLDLRLEIAPGEVVALLGPNGAGKTTALRALAGLVPLTGGHISLDGHPWDAPPRTFLPPERRPVGVVFQDHLLFAHLSAVDNVAFGPRARGTSRAAARDLALRWLDRVGLAEHARAKPRTLSGGQAQRVALARALATDPRLLLLDEPLAALDAATRLHVRAELGRHLAEFRGHTLLVTHDPLDAMVLADRLVVLDHGTLVQQGTPTEVAHHPRNAYTADLVGLNLLRGTAEGTAVTLDGGGVLTLAEPATGPVHLSFPPSAVSVHPAPPTGSPRNTWPVTLTGLEQHAHTTRLRLHGRPPVLADITTAAVADLRLHAGDALWAAVKATEIRAYPATPDR